MRFHKCRTREDQALDFLVPADSTKAYDMKEVIERVRIGSFIVRCLHDCVHA